jgi:hypothetical protein
VKLFFQALGILLLVSLPSALLVYRLFAIYNGRLKDRAGRFFQISIDPENLERFGYKELALISFLSLFLEMLMIRWVSSEIRVFAYLKNFALVACFLGSGFGCYLCRRRIHLFALIGPLFRERYVKHSCQEVSVNSQTVVTTWLAEIPPRVFACHLGQVG